ncbi:MAG: hypothetical protein WDM84_09235 [Bauldia sp.]
MSTGSAIVKTKSDSPSPVAGFSKPDHAARKPRPISPKTGTMMVTI